MKTNDIILPVAAFALGAFIANKNTVSSIGKSITLKESLEKELRKLQRDLNSNRLSTYNLGDESAEEMVRQNERQVKLKRFNAVLELLNTL